MEDSNFPMAKIEIAKVTEIIKNSNLDAGIVKELITAIQDEVKAAEKEAEANPRPPAQKKQYVILVSDPEGVMPEKDLVGWVVQIPESDSPLTTTERIHKAAYDFNASPRGRRNPVSTVGEACESVSQRHFREAQVWVRTKVPVSLITTNNEIPTDGDDEYKVDRRRKEID